MPDLTQLKCKQCGAPLDQSSAINGSIRCKYCGEMMSIATRQQVIQPQEQQHAPLARYGNKSRGVAILLTFFFGYFGIQNFYLNRTGLGIICLLLTWSFIPCILAVIDFIRLICMSEASFNETYNRIA